MLRILYRAFGLIERPLSWFLLGLGFVGAVASAFGWVPPVWLIAVVGFILIAKEGYNDLKESVEDEVEE